MTIPEKKKSIGVLNKMRHIWVLFDSKQNLLKDIKFLFAQKLY